MSHVVSELWTKFGVTSVINILLTLSVISCEKSVWFEVPAGTYHPNLAVSTLSAETACYDVAVVEMAECM